MVFGPGMRNTYNIIIYFYTPLGLVARLRCVLYTYLVGGLHVALETRSEVCNVSRNLLDHHLPVERENGLIGAWNRRMG